MEKAIYIICHCLREVCQVLAVCTHTHQVPHADAISHLPRAEKRP